MKYLLGLMFASAAVMLSAEQNAKTIPVVIELFTSEGCSSCPPADKLLGSLDREQPVAGVQLIVLSEHVDYWNTAGWVDPYSLHEFSERQQKYGTALRLQDVYTPQAVVDGRLEVVGNSAAKLQGAIQQARREKKVPLHLTTSQTAKGIHVELHGEGQIPQGAEVYFAVAEDAVESKVTSGENGGHMLTHTAVVRSLTRGGKLAAAGETGVALDLKANSHWGKHLRVIAFLADHEGGKILGAALNEL